MFHKTNCNHIFESVDKTNGRHGNEYCTLCGHMRNKSITCRTCGKNIATCTENFITCSLCQAPMTYKSEIADALPTRYAKYWSCDECPAIVFEYVNRNDARLVADIIEARI